MKLSDYVASFLAHQGIRHVFAIAGGASLHLIHSLASTPGIDYFCPQHEQAGAMAADGYARVTRHLGAAVATSGPGATNMITGACCSYYDSIPVIYITGQVTTFRLKRDSGVRQMGFQETDVVDMYRPVTKYSVMIEDPQRIRYELEKACYLATSGRPGPVHLDLPDDLQRCEIDPATLEGFTTPTAGPSPQASSADLDHCMELIRQAKRPVVVLGWGVRLAGAENEIEAMVKALGFPVALTWATLDLFPSASPFLVGPFGTHGSRHGNFAIQNADLLLTIGARLDTRETGGYPTFAREARKIVVDIDGAELGKFSRYGMATDVRIQSDARTFAVDLTARLSGFHGQNLDSWYRRIATWKESYPVLLPEHLEEKDVNPYAMVKAFAAACPEDTVIFSDTGCAIAWMTQAFEFKKGQRLFHDYNNTAMGYALPASIGAAIATGKPAVCITGDGSLQMNIQELATVIRHQLPVRIILLNNQGYSMIQQTQDQWLDSRYEASTVAGGLAFPDFTRLAQAYGFRTIDVIANDQLAAAMGDVMAADGPVFCNVQLRPDHRVLPQVKFGRALEDAEPLLERTEFLRNMIVAPDKASLT